MAIAGASRGSLAHARAMRGAAELWIAECTDVGVALGAFQRPAGLVLPAWPAARRGSGGPAVLLGPGTVHVALLLARTDALTPCDAPRLVNRYVRPLLRALTRVGATAHWFGRDWISVAGRPAGWVGFAHDASTGAAVVEAFVAVRAPFACDEGRTSFLGKSPGTLEGITGRPLLASRLVAAIEGAYAAAYGVTTVDAGALPEAEIDPRDPSADPPWAATIAEAMGAVAAGPDARGVLRVGGDWMGSEDAVGELERLLMEAPGATPSDIAELVERALGGPGVVIEGVRARASFCDVIARARAGKTTSD